MTSTAVTERRRARRVAMPEDVRSQISFTATDYQDVLLVDANDAGSTSAEQWMRAMFESAPVLVREFVRLAWLAFGARLGPFPSPDHVLGWQIGRNEPEVFRMDVEWRLGLRAQLVLRVLPSAVVFATFVVHHRRAARVVWPVLVPIHRLIVRYLLVRTVRRHATNRWP